LGQGIPLGNISLSFVPIGKHLLKGEMITRSLGVWELSIFLIENLSSILLNSAAP
jgi:hypothetical protein